MLKQISLMKRHPDLTMQQFIDRYESHHAKFGESLFAHARRFVRRYVHPETNPLTGKVTELDFDVIMEIWWDRREDFDMAMKAIATAGDVIAAVRESGRTLFASHDNPSFTVEEHDTDLGTDWAALLSRPRS